MNVLMPQLGETVSEGKILAWFKSAGDVVAAGDVLFEIETDKVNFEVEAIESGVLSEIRFPAGVIVPVGSTVGVIGDRGNESATSASLQPASTPQKSSLRESTEETSQSIALDPFMEVRTSLGQFGKSRIAGDVFATPLARRLAAENDVDLVSMAKRDHKSKIRAADVRAFVEASPVMSAEGSPGKGEAGKAVKGEVVPLTGLRSRIATRLVASKRDIPHFYLSLPVCVDALLQLRSTVNEALSKIVEREARKISINDFIIKAWAMALIGVPDANSIFDGDHLVKYQAADVGVAVAVEGGVLTPVVHDAHAKTVTAISREVEKLATLARERRLRPDQYSGGVSSVSNLGMYGVNEFSAIINPPQSSILAIGKASRVAVEASEGLVRFETRINATLSCDHRVIDGAVGAEALAGFKRFVENPILLVA